MKKSKQSSLPTIDQYDEEVRDLIACHQDLKRRMSMLKAIDEYLFPKEIIKLLNDKPHD